MDQSDIVVAPEHSYTSPNGPLTEEMQNEYVLELLEASRFSKALVIPGTCLWREEATERNTCYAFYRGNELHRHHKGRFSEFHPITTFEFLGMKVGIEICIEAGRLAIQGEKDLDFHVLTSYWMHQQQNINALKVGGYGLVVDGEGPAYT